MENKKIQISVQEGDVKGIALEIKKGRKEYIIANPDVPIYDITFDVVSRTTEETIIEIKRVTNGW